MTYKRILLKLSGEALMGNFKGDVVEYEVGEHVRQAEVLEVTVSQQ